MNQPQKPVTNATLVPKTPTSPLNKQLSGALKPSAPAATSPIQTFQSFLQAHKSEFAAVIPKHVPIDRILRLALSVASRTPRLLECSMPSLAGAIMQCTALGLEPGTPLKQAHIIPFKNNKTGCVEAQLVIDYHGYIELMYRTNKVMTVFAHPVYKDDTFKYEYGTEEFIKHVPSKIAANKTNANITDFYAYAKMTNGAYRFVVMSKEDVNKIRDEYSQAFINNPKDPENPWVKHYVSMGRKTVVKALQTWVPKSSELQTAIVADNTTFDPLKDTDLNPMTLDKDMEIKE